MEWKEDAISHLSAQFYLQTWYWPWARWSQVMFLWDFMDYLCAQLFWHFQFTSHLLCVHEPSVYHTCSLGLPGFWVVRWSYWIGVPANCHMSGRPVSATFSLLLQILLHWNFQKIATIIQAVWSIVAVLSKAFSVLWFNVSGLWVYERRGSKLFALYIETDYSSTF